MTYIKLLVLLLLASIWVFNIISEIKRSLMAFKELKLRRYSSNYEKKKLFKKAVIPIIWALSFIALVTVIILIMGDVIYNI